MINLLVVEDDANTRKLMRAILKREGFEVLLAEHAEAALEVLDSHSVNLIVLDIMMPGMDGYEFTELLRKSNYDLPILMLTAKQLSADKKKGFVAGTDDYVTKPVDSEELVLRIKALLRRARIANERQLSLGGVTLDYDSLTVVRGSDRQSLPQKEFYLLYKLLSYPDRIFTRLQLMDEIWGMASESSDATVNVHVNRLRRRFENYPEFDLISVRGLGYKVVVHS